MSFKNSLQDIINQCAIDGIDCISLTPQEDGTILIDANDSENLFIKATSLLPVPEITGRMGIGDIKILKGLISATAFQNEDAVIAIGSRTIGEETFPDTITFTHKKTKAFYRLMDKNAFKEANTKAIPWDITIELNPSKIAEFDQMSRLYKDTNRYFKIRSEESQLVVDFGIDSSSTHSGSMVLHEELEKDLVGENEFIIDRFLTVVKKGMQGDNKCSMNINARGIMGVTASTSFANYNYLLRKKL